jgi:hypothetical protein
MSWVKIMLILVVILLYIPLVFMGANVFFSDYSGSNSDYNAYKSCSYAPDDKTSSICTQNDTCMTEQMNEQKAFEESKNNYNGNKYIFIVILNLIVLLLALFITFDDNINIGLFLGSTLTSFISTWTYFETQSRIGFGILFAIFFVSIYFITKKKSLFLLKEKN